MKALKKSEPLVTASVPPMAETIPLHVGRRPDIHHHYYGPHIGGDGVIILRGDAGGARQVRVQGGDATVRLGG